jgi:DNA/RNA endonuclease G (NUC1)
LIFTAVRTSDLILYTHIICDSYRKDSDGKTYVIYEVIGANSVAVPTHFFKVIVAETADQKLDMEAYVMPNQVIDDSTPLTAFQVTHKEVTITEDFCKKKKCPC